MSISVYRVNILVVGRWVRLKGSKRPILASKAKQSRADLSKVDDHRALRRTPRHCHWMCNNMTRAQSDFACFEIYPHWSYNGERVERRYRDRESWKSASVSRKHNASRWNIAYWEDHFSVGLWGEVPVSKAPPWAVFRMGEDEERADLNKCRLAFFLSLFSPGYANYTLWLVSFWCTTPLYLSPQLSYVTWCESFQIEHFL